MTGHLAGTEGDRGAARAGRGEQARPQRRPGQRRALPLPLSALAGPSIVAVRLTLCTCGLGPSDAVLSFYFLLF